VLGLGLPVGAEADRLRRRAAISAASRTGPALPSPITASRFFIAASLLLDPICEATFSVHHTP
jgi:hypothetical protein